MLFFPPAPRYRLYSAEWGLPSLIWSLAFDADAGEDEFAALETDVQRQFQVDHALVVNQARLGMYLATKALVTDQKRRVVMSPYTIFDVVNMVIAAGGEPVFADIQPHTCNVDPAQVEALIDDRTAMVLVTHLHGLACDIGRITEICRRRQVSLVEDAAQAVGTRVDGQRVGTFGDAGVFSFGMMKNVNSFFGGIVVSNNPELHAAMRRAQADFPPIERGQLLRQALYGALLNLATYPPLFRLLTFWIFRYGFLHKVPTLMSISRSENNPVQRSGLPEHYKRRMRGVQARLAGAQLPRIDILFERRLAVARLYHRGLSDVPDIILPPLAEDGSHAYMYFPIQVPDREQLLTYLMRNGRDIAGQHLLNCADLPCFHQFARNCPNARRTAVAIVLLPTYPKYGRKEAKKTLRMVRNYYLSGARKSRKVSGEPVWEDHRAA